MEAHLETAGFAGLPLLVVEVGGYILFALLEVKRGVQEGTGPLKSPELPPRTLGPTGGILNWGILQLGT